MVTSLLPVVRRDRNWAYQLPLAGSTIIPTSEGIDSLCLSPQNESLVRSPTLSQYRNLMGVQHVQTTNYRRCTGGEVTEKQLAQARLLNSAMMPDGTSYV